MSRKLKILLVFFYIFLFSFLLKTTFDHLDPDFGWHLKVGEFISQTKEVPFEENYNHTLEGQKWVDHEWLLNYLSYGVYENFGYSSLGIIFSLVTLLTFFLINYFFFKKWDGGSVKFFIFFALEILAFVALLAHVGVRMQMFTLLLLFLLIMMLDEYAKKRNKKILYFLPLLFFAWANLHAGFILGLFVVWLFLIQGFLMPFIKRFIKKDFFKVYVFKKTELKTFSLFAILSSLVTLLTPYHFNYFLFIFKYSNTFYLTHIVEWLPVWYAPINYYQLMFEVLFVVLLLILIVEKKIKRINFWPVLLSFCLLVFTFKARRNFPLFFVGSIPFFVEAILVLVGEEKKKMAVFEKRIIVFFLSACFVCATFVFLLETNFSNKPFSNEKFCESNPCEILQQIKELPKKEWTVYNSYNWGGYLIWEWPENKMFIDGRLPMLPKNGQTIMEEYYDFKKAGKSEEMLNLYGIDLVVNENFRGKKYDWFEKFFFGLKDKEKQVDELEKYLMNNKEWKKLYQDDLGYVYYR